MHKNVYGIRNMNAFDREKHPAPQRNASVGPVLLVTPWYRPSVGGVAEVAERLRRTLTESGVTTHLFVCEEEASGYHIEAHPTVPNVWYFRVPSAAFGWFAPRSVMQTLFRGVIAFNRLFRFVKTYDVRTMVLIYPTASAWLFLLFRYVGGIRLITSCHGNDITRYGDRTALGRWLLRRVLQGSHALIVCADHLAKKAQALCPGAALPIHFIPNCVDTAHFVPPSTGLNRRNPEATLLHVSNFAPKKRTLDIIEAFAIAALPRNSRLIMVGSGPDFEAATERARTLGVSHRVDFVGIQKDVRPFLWQADLFVLASEDEGAPLVLLEAMACNLPWVSTAWGVAAMLPDGECGLVVPPRTPQRLAAAMVELINDSERRLAMGRRGRYHAEAEFGEAKYVARHTELIRNAEWSNNCHAVALKE